MEEQPIFRTGLGKSVEVKKSSIARARSVLGEMDGTLTDAGMYFLLIFSTFRVISLLI